MSDANLDQLRIEREPERENSGNAWLWIVLALLIAGGAAAYYWWTREPVYDVSTSAVRELRSESATTVLNASGYVTARRQATVSSKVTGKVVEVLIEGRHDRRTGPDTGPPG